MKISAVTRKSHYYNEDRFVIGKSFCMVIDGASPLKKKNEFNEARWFVEYIKKNISSRKGSIKERLLTISKDAYSMIPEDANHANYLPSASMSWLEWDDEYFYASVLGDCEVCFVHKDNSLTRCFDLALSRLDAIAIDEMKQKAREKGVSIREGRNLVLDTLIKHRNMANKPGGYAAFVLSDNPEINEKVFKVKKDEVKEVYLYSDGFSQSFEFLDIYPSHSEMFASSLDIKSEIEKIEQRSFADSDCEKYPRFKKIDDITAIKIEM